MLKESSEKGSDVSDDRFDLEAALGEVASQGLARAHFGLLRNVAEHLWYQHDVPDLNKVAPQWRRDAGYLVDRLVRFNVLSKDRKLRVLTALSPFRPHCSPVSTCKDPLAVKWGASSDLTGRLGELMPYQTRQYAANQAKRYSA
jgi:hypothetical protein